MVRENSSLLHRACASPRLVRALSPVLGLVLLLGSLALGLHQHHDTQAHPSCAACNAGHAPATVTDAAPLRSTLPVLAERPVVAPLPAPRTGPRVAISSRAPPLG
jgi:hypothetical protein